MRTLHRLVGLLLRRQKRVTLSCIALGVILLLTQNSCVSVGPIKSRNEFFSMVTKSIDLGGESIQDYGRAEWYPGVDAYRLSSMLSNSEEFETGVVVLLDCRFMFLTWNQKLDCYKIQHEFAYKDIADVRRRVWGGSQRIAIEGNGGLVNAFSLLSNNGIGVSVARINRALAFLRTKIPSSDAIENTYKGSSCQ